jgi:hypothetical protein
MNLMNLGSQEHPVETRRDLFLNHNFTIYRSAIKFFLEIELEALPEGLQR